MVSADRRILRHFGGRVYRVKVGRDIRREDLVTRVASLIARIQPDAVVSTVLEQSTDYLAALLNDGPPRLLIIDDVWTEDHLAAFPVSGRCARLVTTRSQPLAAAAGVPIEIGQFEEQARSVLLSDLQHPLPSSVVQGLLKETGQWPLMLRLTNKILINRTRLHKDITYATEELLRTIRRARLRVDELSGAPTRLDVSDPDQRRRAIRATIEASVGLLDRINRSRFAELGVFARGEAIPICLIAALWQATGGLDHETSETLCAQLADLALVTLIRNSDGGSVELHDVIREFLQEELAPSDSNRRTRSYSMPLPKAFPQKQQRSAAPTP